MAKTLENSCALDPKALNHKKLELLFKKEKNQNKQAVTLQPVY